jgi:NAD(P)-dependent dehydrogenase (short-subunit alcohol dehydrogenase family)
MLAAAGRSVESCKAAAQEIEEATGRGALPYGVHVGRWDELPALVDAVYDRFGRRDILNVGSAGSIRPRPAIVPYAATKAGLNALTEGLAPGLGPEVRVDTLMCGLFATQATSGWDREQFAEDVRPHALQRIGAPAEVAGAALYLISGASSYTSGATLRVDGGMP